MNNTAYHTHSLKICQQIEIFLQEKNWSQKDLALALGKKEPEVSRWMNGTHNFTFKTIAKLEEVFGRPIITYGEQNTKLENQEPGFTGGHLIFV